MKDETKRNAKSKAKKLNEDELSQEREQLLRDIFSSDDGNLPLMHQLARTLWSFRMAYEKSVGFSGPQVLVLLMLAKKGPQVGLTQSDLTRIMKVDASAITRMVRTMEDKNWITREADPTDNRLTRVFLTPVGREIAQNLPERARSMEEVITRNLNKNQIEELRHILDILQANAQHEYQKNGRDHQPQATSPETPAALLEV